MDQNTRNSSNRRRFLKTTALAGAGWASSLPTAKLFGDALGSIVGGRPSRELPPHGEVRIGLMGLGGHHEMILNAIPKIPGARLAAVALAEGEQFATVASHLASRQRTQLYHSYQEMLESEKLEVVASCLPFNLNAHASIIAARQGCHIISEKPLATDLEALAALESAVRDNNVQITAMLPMRSQSGVAAVRKAVADGLIGEPIVTFVRKTYRAGSAAYGPESAPVVFPWAGVHALDCIGFVTDLSIVQASAVKTGRDLAFGCGGCTGVLTKLSNGSTGIVSLEQFQDDSSPSGGDRLRVAGAGGAVEMAGGRVVLTAHDGESRELPQPTRRYVLETFVSSLRGLTSHVVTSEEAFRITRMSLIVRQAVEEGRVLSTC